MSLVLDSIYHKRLVTVKRLYQLAETEASSADVGINHILAVIHFDLAVETCIRIVINALGKKETGEQFNQIAQKANDLLTKANFNPLPDRLNIDRVHDVRNDAQHNNKPPILSLVNDCRTYTRDFLDKVVQDVWGLNFTQISLIDLIQNSELKQYLLDSLNSLDARQYEASLTSSGAAMTSALSKAEEVILGSGLHGLDSGLSRRLDEVINYFSSGGRIVETLVRSARITTLFVLGVDFQQYIKYRLKVGEVVFTGGGPVLFSSTNVFDQVSAEFGLEYCTNMVIQIESKMGDLKKPFGYEGWRHLPL